MFQLELNLFNTDKKNTAEKIKKNFFFIILLYLSFLSGVGKHIARLQSPQMLWTIPLQDLPWVIISWNVLIDILYIKRVNWFYPTKVNKAISITDRS